MKILCVGDVVGRAGQEYIAHALPSIKRGNSADLVIINGENSDDSGVGLTKSAADFLLQYADVITTGNHCYRRANEDFYIDNERCIHPANFPYTLDEAGCCVVDTGLMGEVCVVNLMGTAWLEPIDNPFKRMDELLERTQAKYIIVDFHAESTAEKKAFAFYLDGRVGAIFGTHTHVQTADEQILPQGTGFITDVGMAGPAVSVLGVNPEDAVKKQKTHGMVRFHVASGPCMLNAVLFTLDDKTGMCTAVKRICKTEWDFPPET